MLSSPSTYWSEIKQGARDEEICIFKRKRERDDDDDEISPPVSLPKSSPNSGGGSIDHGHVAAAFSCGARPGGRCARGSSTDGRGQAHVVRGTGASFIYDGHGRTPMAARTSSSGATGKHHAPHQFMSAAILLRHRTPPTPSTAPG